MAEGMPVKDRVEVDRIARESGPAEVIRIALSGSTPARKRQILEEVMEMIGEGH